MTNAEQNRPQAPAIIQPLRTWRMLTVAQKLKPFGKGTANGPFKNVSIQVGVIDRKPTDPANLFWVKPRVDARSGLPFILPKGGQLPEAGTLVKVIGSVTSIRDQFGHYHPAIVARSFERPNILDGKPKTLTSIYNVPVIGSTAEDNGKPVAIKNQDDANNHAWRGRTGAENTVELAGIVVKHERRPGILDEKGQYTRYPSLIIYLRQDSNPDILIPVRYTSGTEGNINRAAENTPWSALIHVRGEHRVSRIPALLVNEDGKPVPELNENGSVKLLNGQPVFQVLKNEDGTPVMHYHSEIVVRAPETALKDDIEFLRDGTPPPAWIIKLLKDHETEVKEAAAAALKKRAAPPTPTEPEVIAPPPEAPDAPIQTGGLVDPALEMLRQMEQREQSSQSGSDKTD